MKIEDMTLTHLLYERSLDSAKENPEFSLAIEEEIIKRKKGVLESNFKDLGPLAVLWNIIKGLIKVILSLGFIYLCFMGFLMLLFLPISRDVNLEVPQSIGGAILVNGTEKHYDNGCNYDIELSYFEYGVGEYFKIGRVSQSVPNKICHKMDFYSKLNISKNSSGFILEFNDGENEKIIFTSQDRNVWNDYLRNLHISTK